MNVLALNIENAYMPLLLAVMAMGIGLFTLRRARQRAGRNPSGREVLDQLREGRQIHGAMSTLMVELEEYTRRMNAVLDTKSAKLECLIRDADERLTRLERAQRGAAVAVPPTAGQTPIADAPPAPAAPTASAAPEPARPPTPITPPPAVPVASPPRTPSVPASPPRPVHPAPAPRRAPAVTVGPLGQAPAPAPTPQAGEVYRLADAGRSPMQIAQATDLPLGEVELMLQLRELS
jgi:hypothetical protein